MEFKTFNTNLQRYVNSMAMGLDNQQLLDIIRLNIVVGSLKHSGIYV